MRILYFANKIEGFFVCLLKFTLGEFDKIHYWVYCDKLFRKKFSIGIKSHYNDYSRCFRNLILENTYKEMFQNLEEGLQYTIIVIEICNNLMA